MEERNAEEVFNEFNEAVLDKVEKFTDQINAMDISLENEEDEKKLDRLIKITKEMGKIRELILGPPIKPTNKKSTEEPKPDEDKPQSKSVEDRLKDNATS